ncbi:hypothetical protein ACZ90_55300 [Streptomyces albus subsp. albus]|nr:hypothetical protein ACZ90_55300 [Streptomyces albus subsp. albus]
MHFTATPRGARLARRLVSVRLAEWGIPYDAPTNERLTLIAAELCANAVRHGFVAGRDFHLRLVRVGKGVIRIEVSDTRHDRRPSIVTAPSDSETGRGLCLVSRLADRWAVSPRPGGAPGKTVWAECAMEAP